MNHSSVINFTKHRYLFFIISVLVIIGGLAGMIANGGFNLGIDFQAGLSQRIQIADAALEITYQGADDVTLDVVNRNLVLEFRNQDGVRRTIISSVDHPTINALAAALEEEDGIGVTVFSGSAESTQIVTGLNLPFTLSEEPVLINTANADVSAYISIDEVREAVSGVAGSPQVQIVGDAVQQEFQIRVQASVEGEKEELESEILSMLAASFGADSIVTKQSDYVGPKFSNLLTYRSIIMVAVALALIMVYIWIRFKFASALSAITALAHDILVMLGVIAVFRLEVTTTTIAALLTIIGYSLNDTIVVFDRIRENTGLLKGKKFERIVNTSITQSLSRTLITSLTTLLAVIPLFIFASGAIRLFALNLIIGIIVGTYSSIFVASPILLAVTNRQIQRKARHLGKDPAVILAEQAEKEAPKAVQQTQQEIEIPSAQRKLRGKRRS